MNFTDLEEHAAISIIGNEALVTFIEDEGLSGNGTSAFPYIIENFNVSRSPMSMDISHSIGIQSTDAYLIIRNCVIADNAFFDRGIYLNETTNVKVINNTIRNHQSGIVVHASSNINLSGNIVDDGIYIQYGYNITLSRNTVVGDGWGSGISLWYSSNSTLFENTVEYCTNGISLKSSNNNTLSGNIVKYCKNIGISIQLSSSSNNMLTGNTASYGYAGIGIAHSDSNVLYGNTANSNLVDGINLANASNNILSENIANNNNRYGIVIGYNSYNNTLSGNIANGNYVDVYIYDDDATEETATTDPITTNPTTTKATPALLFINTIAIVSIIARKKQRRK